MEQEVSRSAIEALLSQAALAHPKECCGILLSDGETISTAVPSANVHPAPKTHFEIDPAALIAAHKTARTGGPVIAGYYHSHPDGPPVPSATDSAMAAQDGKVWAIIGGGEVKLWRDLPGGFAPLPYRIHDR